MDGAFADPPVDFACDLCWGHVRAQHLTGEPVKALDKICWVSIACTKEAFYSTCDINYSQERGMEGINVSIQILLAD